MAVIRPFMGLRPRPEIVQKVSCLPYDVINSEEAREMAKGNPISFLHCTKPEIDLPPGTNLYDDKVYATGKTNFQRFRKEEIFLQDKLPCLYVYRQKWGDHIQTGLMACASCDDYDADIIKKHERTRKDKEDDRTRHTAELGCNAGPVFLTYRRVEKISEIIGKIEKAKQPIYDFSADYGVTHALWIVDDQAAIKTLVEEFKRIPYLYVADGHHRSASASRVRALRKSLNPHHAGNEEYNFFLAVMFAGNELKILDYNRAVKDLNGLSADDFMKKVEEKFLIAPAKNPQPVAKGAFAMFFDGKWRGLTAKKGTYPENHPIDSLDVSILQNNLLAPILGIEDPRTSKRIDFVGGIRGLAELEKRVKSDCAVAFALAPTSIEQLMAVADAGEIMPPKSTWFEPKLRSGLVVHLLD
jgi:uncharacterized protein (DUF1015 family)